MKREIKAVFKVLKEYSIITLGLLIYVLGWTIFLIPSNLIGGGVTGFGSIIQYATGGVIKVGYTYFVVNVALLIAALFTLGKSFGTKTVYAIIVVSIGLNVFQTIIPETITQVLAIDNGKLMSTIMGGIMAGAGIGMCMSQGGSTGGTDIIALIVNKYRGVSPGRMILTIDLFIIMSSLLIPSYTPAGELVPFVTKITNIVYGLMLTVVCSTVLDLYISGAKQSVQVFIISKKSDEIADMIANDVHRGVTVLTGEGWYTKSQVRVLMVLTLKSDLNLMLRLIKIIDPDAFVSVGSVSGVYGKGFDSIKSKSADKKELAERKDQSL
ncbi:MAG: YitT family protein [Rikenellaceae bacterium]|nr:YitT family protein [Rikenellaceae bacterium]